jgi:hypothetical protein
VNRVVINMDGGPHTIASAQIGHPGASSSVKIIVSKLEVSSRRFLLYIVLKQFYVSRGRIEIICVAKCRNLKTQYPVGPN